MVNVPGTSRQSQSCRPAGDRERFGFFKAPCKFVAPFNAALLVAAGREAAWFILQFQLPTSATSVRWGEALPSPDIARAKLLNVSRAQQSFAPPSALNFTLITHTT